jgi:nucleoid-associated protein YgaU
MAENATATAETTVPETMETEAAVEDTTEVTEEPQPTPTPEPTVESETPQTQAAVAQPTAYTIKKGDTLIGISLRNYGSNTKVSEICALNGITDPDDIKIGQEILLP